MKYIVWTMYRHDFNTLVEASQFVRRAYKVGWTDLKIEEIENVGE